jgi:hypothetical protein
VAQPVHGVLVDASGTRAFTNCDAGPIKAAAEATNVSPATKAADVSATAEAAHVSAAAEAAAHTASVPAAASAAPRIGLRNSQARSQQGCRQNRHRFSHIAYSIQLLEWRALLPGCAQLPMSLR